MNATGSVVLCPFPDSTLCAFIGECQLRKKKDESLTSELSQILCIFFNCIMPRVSKVWLHGCSVMRDHSIDKKELVVDDCSNQER